MGVLKNAQTLLKRVYARADAQSDAARHVLKDALEFAQVQMRALQAARKVVLRRLVAVRLVPIPPGAYNRRKDAHRAVIQELPGKYSLRLRRSNS
ncbi:MAG TPA: hypothetical protein PKD64_19450 [Pirellulaceae bacterium]|nr:hypothetical protein [Pirellulaceae bacterium]